jgi:TRAP-type C4-dicarboxylate transport system substrate-binding protein
VVDGAENNLPSFYLSRHYEVCKFYSLDEHTFSPDVLLVGTHFWEELSDQEQGWVQEAVAHSITYQRKLWAEAEIEALQEVKKAGVEIIPPDKRPFAQRAQQVYRQFEQDEELYGMIRQIQAMEE